MAASFDRFTCTVTNAIELNSKTMVTVTLTADQGSPAWTSGAFGLLTADGRWVRQVYDDPDSINDQFVSEGQTVVGNLTFDGAIEGSYLIMLASSGATMRFALA